MSVCQMILNSRTVLSMEYDSKNFRSAVTSDKFKWFLWVTCATFSRKLLWRTLWVLKWSLKVTQVLRNSTVRKRIDDLLLKFHTNYGLILYQFPRCSEILADKCKFFLSLVYLTPRPTGFPIKFCKADEHKKTRMVGLSGGEIIWYLHPFGYNIRVWETDRRTSANG